MNCGDFRYLIQRRFDVELSSSDDRALLIHLETCDSCQKFYHQVQQVIVAAEEMNLPEDLLCPYSDLLSDKVFQVIPRSQSGIFSIFTEIFSRFKKTPQKNNGTGGLLPEPTNGDRLKHLSIPRFGNWGEKNESGQNQGAFAGPIPQVEKAEGTEGRVVGTWGAWSTSPASDSKGPPLADLVNRSDAVSEGTEPDFSEQQVTRSLGEKFSRFVGQVPEGAGPNTQPLNLAESIKRRIAEMPKPVATEAIAQGTDETKMPANQDTDSYYDADTFGQWGIPHSPDWPKINSALDLEKSNQNAAPESWGKADGWGNKVGNQSIQQTPTPVPDNQNRGGWLQLGSPEAQQASPLADAAALWLALGENENPPAQVAPESVSAGQIFATQAAAVPEHHPLDAIIATGQVSGQVDGQDSGGVSGEAGGDELEQILSQQSRHWSHQAEQLETGSWQSVDFDSQQLGSTKSQNLPAISQDFIQQALASPAVVPAPLPFPEAAAGTLPTFPIQSAEAAGSMDQPTQQIAQPSEPLAQSAPAMFQQPVQPGAKAESSALQPNAQENTGSRAQLDLAARLQNAIQASASGPKIYPVVSKKAQDPKARASFPALDAVQPAVKQQVATPINQSHSLVNQPAQPVPSQPGALPPPANRPLPPPINQPAISPSNRSASLPASEMAIPARMPTPPTRSFPPERPAGLPEIPPVKALAQPIKSNTQLPAVSPEPSAQLVASAPATPQPILGTQPGPISQSVQAVAQSKAAETNKQVSEDNSSRLFNLDDSAIDNLFSENLGIHERANAVSTPIAPITPSVPAASTNVPSAAEPANNEGIANQANRLFAIDDQAIDQIFSANLGIPQQKDGMPILPAEVQNMPVKSSLHDNPISNTTSSYNSLSIVPAPLSSAPVSFQDSIPASTLTPAPMPNHTPLPVNSQLDATPEGETQRQKVSGIDRLDGRSEASPETGSGRIAAIGKFLLDNKDLEKIGKITASDFSERGMRTLSVEAHKELSNLLKQIDSQVGVIGTMIVGHDGLLIANTVPQELEAESLSKWAQAIYMGTTQTLDKLGSERVRQIVSQTERGYLIIANFGAGLLISLTNPLMIDHLLPLMRTITQLVAS